MHEDVQPPVGVESTDLLPQMYEELRRMAAVHMAREHPGQTLQATALVHEAWTRLSGGETPPVWSNRAHFFGAAAEAMRRKRQIKRGGNSDRVPLEESRIEAPGGEDKLLQMHDVLDRLVAEGAL